MELAWHLAAAALDTPIDAVRKSRECDQPVRARQAIPAMEL
jgi:hypothetical protein